MDDTRNVSDKYKSWHEDLIKQDLNAKTFPYATMMETWGDFNFGTMVRNANAFAAKEVFYFGKRKWDKRAAQGSYHYTNVQYIENLNVLTQLKNSYQFVAIDNVVGSIPITNYRWQPNSLLIFGSEGEGISKDILDLCDTIVEIPMYGSIRSLNCGTSSGIVMMDYIRKFQENCMHWNINMEDMKSCLHCRAPVNPADFGYPRP